MGDFELDLFLNFGRHLFARIVRRFSSYIKRRSRENGGAVWPNGSVSITPKRSDSAACKPLLFRARALRRGRAHHQQSPIALAARPTRASPRPDSIPARSAELTWPRAR